MRAARRTVIGPALITIKVELQPREARFRIQERRAEIQSHTHATCLGSLRLTTVSLGSWV